MADKEITTKIPMELVCISILQERDMYGYEMIHEIETRSGGLLRFSLATLYICMRRLEEKGYVTSRNEVSAEHRARLRVYYHLEPGAEPYMEKLLRNYRRCTEGVQKLLETCEISNENPEA